MGARVVRVEKANGGPSGAEEIRARLEQEGLRPHEWGNDPGYEYEWHSHGYEKVLYCVSGSIVFHTGEDDFELEPGDRMEIDPGTEHAATVGPEGVECLEAAR